MAEVSADCPGELTTPTTAHNVRPCCNQTTLHTSPSHGTVFLIPAEDLQPGRQLVCVYLNSTNVKSTTNYATYRRFDHFEANKARCPPFFCFIATAPSGFAAFRSGVFGSGDANSSAANPSYSSSSSSSAHSSSSPSHSI